MTIPTTAQLKELSARLHDATGMVGKLGGEFWIAAEAMKDCVAAMNALVHEAEKRQAQPPGIDVQVISVALCGDPDCPSCAAIAKKASEPPKSATVLSLVPKPEQSK